MNHELLHKALNDRDSDVRQRALEHPRIADDHISKALDDHDLVVVRAHDHTGQEIYRATLQPHLNTKGNHAYAVDFEYGLKHPAFTAHAHDVAQRLSGSPDMNDPIHRKSDYVYNDNNQHFILHPNLTAEHLTQLENHPSKEIQGYRDWETDRKSTRLNSSHRSLSRMPSSA